METDSGSLFGISESISRGPGGDQDEMTNKVYSDILDALAAYKMRFQIKLNSAFFKSCPPGWVHFLTFLFGESHIELVIGSGPPFHTRHESPVLRR